MQIHAQEKKCPWPQEGTMTKRLSGQSQRNTVPSSSISDWMKKLGEETESVGGEEAQGTIFLSEFDLARAMTPVHARARSSSD
jgi:hypothetical protein